MENFKKIITISKQNVLTDEEVAVKYVEILTHSGLPNLDAELMTELKKLCKKSTPVLEKVYCVILRELKKPHAEVRNSSFQLCKELFQRSHLFRLLVIKNLDLIFELAAGTNPEKPLPRPKDVSNTLKTTALATLSEWKKRFGSSYVQLNLFCNYLTDSKDINFKEVEENIERHTRNENRKERERQYYREQKMQNYQKEFDDIIGEIENNIDIVTNCTDLLIPTLDDFFLDTNNEAEDYTISSDFSKSDHDRFDPRQFGLSHTYSINISLNPNKKISIQRTNENSSVIDNLQDSLKLLKKKFLPKVRNWITVVKENTKDETKISTVLYVQQKIEKSLDKCKELNIEGIHCSDSESEDDDFINVEKEGYEDKVIEFPFNGPSTSCTSSKIEKTVKLENSPNLDYKAYEPNVTRKESKNQMFETEGDLLETVDKVISGSPDRKQNFLIKESNDVSIPIKALPSVLPHDRKTNKEPTPGSSKECYQSLSGQNKMLSSEFDFSTTNNTKKSSNGLLESDNFEENFKNETTTDTIKEEQAIVTETNRKQRLMAIAPKLPYDIDLYHWEDEKLTPPTLLSIKMDNPKFWGSGDVDDREEIPDPRGAAALRTRVIEFSGKFEPVKWTCRAPLPSGKLCPRRDRIKCPFHGRVVPRDEQGKCIRIEDENPGTSFNEKSEDGANEEVDPVPDWQDPKLLAELKAATGIDLKMPEKKKKKKCKEIKETSHRKRRKKGQPSADVLEEIKKRNFPGLTDVEVVNKDVKLRLKKKVFNKSSQKRVAQDIRKLELKKHNDKFGDQFNYVFT